MSGTRPARAAGSPEISHDVSPECLPKSYANVAVRRAASQPASQASRPAGRPARPGSRASGQPHARGHASMEKKLRRGSLPFPTPPSSSVLLLRPSVRPSSSSCSCLSPRGRRSAGGGGGGGGGGWRWRRWRLGLRTNTPPTHARTHAHAPSKGGCPQSRRERRGATWLILPVAYACLKD